MPKIKISSLLKMAIIVIKLTHQCLLKTSCMPGTERDPILFKQLLIVSVDYNGFFGKQMVSFVHLLECPHLNSVASLHF